MRKVGSGVGGCNGVKRRKRGRGKVWDWVKGAASKANSFLKNTKILSTVAKAIPATSAYAGTVERLGYGRQRGGKKYVHTGPMKPCTMTFMARKCGAPKSAAAKYKAKARAVEAALPSIPGAMVASAAKKWKSGEPLPGEVPVVVVSKKKRRRGKRGAKAPAAAAVGEGSRSRSRSRSRMGRGVPVNRLASLNYPIATAAALPRY